MLQGVVIVVAHGLQLADSRIDHSPTHPQLPSHIRDAAKADLQRLNHGVAASVVFRQRTEVEPHECFVRLIVASKLVHPVTGLLDL